MNRIFKKSVSVFLAVLMLTSVSLSVMASASEDKEYPTIHLAGAQTYHIVTADGETIYPYGVDAGELIKGALMPCLEKLLLGFITGDYTEYTKEFQKAYSPVFEKAKLDNNGEVSDGSHSKYNVYNREIPVKTSGYGNMDYEFYYDWRVSPLQTADELKLWIDKVKAATGESKVNLIGRCYGANVVAAYLEKYKEHAIVNVADVSYLCSSIMGIDTVDAIFSGNIVIEDEAANNFIDYYLDEENLIEDEAASELVQAVVAVLNQAKVLGYTGEMIKALLDEIKYDLFPALLKDSYGTMPSYWSMVSPDKYEEARDFVFKDCKDEYAGLIEKTDAYYEQVQLNYYETREYLEDNGITFYYFVKYNFPNFPLYEGAAHQSDATTSVEKQSFGATTADYGKVLSEEYIAGLATTKYLSPDHKIDASTCLDPERTWFVKNLHHETFPGNFIKIAMEVMLNDYTVSNGSYSQFLLWENGKVSGPVVPDEDFGDKEPSRFDALIRFVKAVINFILNLFRNAEVKQ